MKTKFLAAAIATCFAVPVMAQSNVTVYGIADDGLVKNTDQAVRVASGIASGSRLGVKGIEDIGNGYKATFTLEARVELDNGTQKPTLLSDEPGLYLTKGMDAFPVADLNKIRGLIQPKGVPGSNPTGALFDRTAMVGLETPGGTIQIGQMYTPAFELFLAADVFGSGTGGNWGSITGGTAGFTSLGVDVRSAKSIQYRFSSPSGFGGSVMYGAKGSGHLTRYNKFYGIATTYKANGWDVGVGHNRGYNQNDQASLVSSIIGGSYTMGDYKFFAGYLDQRNRNSVLLPEYIGAYDGLVAPGVLARDGASIAASLRNVFVTNITSNSQLDASSYQFGMHYRVGAGRFMASFAHQNDRTASNSDARLVGLGYDYDLSKRTDIYASVSQIWNQNDGQYSPGSSGSTGGFTKTPGENVRAYQVGIRHRF